MTQESIAKKYENARDYRDSWYALSANRLLATLGSLKKEVNCDVCVIGAGFTGLSAAVELAQKGYRVIILEKGTVAHSASGRNGGQVMRGWSQPPGWLIDKFGIETARVMADISTEGMGLIQRRIDEYHISCDFKQGHLTAALKPAHVRDLEREIKDWARLGQDGFSLLGQQETRALVHSDSYIGGLYDAQAGHFHPLNYALGIAQAAQRFGAVIYEGITAQDVIPGPQCTVLTDKGSLKAKYVLVAGALDMKGLGRLRRSSISAVAHILSTVPLGKDLARQVMSRDIAVADARFIMDYYRFTNDYRLLFGGNCNYTNREYPGEDKRLRGRMTEIFPQLADVPVDHFWQGPIEFTANRMPHIGRLAPQVYFAHGFGGHGVVATNILGKVLAEAIAGTAARFDVFDKIGHTPFIGGDWLKRPLFALGMTWFRLRDML